MTIHAVPRVPPGLAVRPRLTARLDAPVAVVVLQAPSGFGKTAALTQWASTSERAGVWFRAREGRSEPAAFVQEISAELDDAGLLGEGNPLLTAAESLILNSDPWSLLRRGLLRIPGELTIVLDEAEHLDDATIGGILQTVQEHPGLSLRVATRIANRFTEPGLGLAIELDRLGPDDLALTPDEAAEILGPSAAPGTLAHVLEHGASPALARIVGLAGGTTADSGQDAVEAAVTSLLRVRSSSWDQRFRSFLGRISLSEVVDVELARELTSDPEPKTMLDRAEAEGLGYWTAPTARGDRRTKFVPSPVFRRILSAAMRRELPGRVVRELDARIARWHLAGGRAFPALQAAVLSRDGSLVTDVVRVHWNDLFRNAEEVRELFRRVSPLTLRSQPLPCMLLALMWNARGAHRMRAVEYFALAAYGARAQRAAAAPADRALLAAIESAAHRVSGRTEPALRAATAGLETLRAMTLEERDRLGRNEPTIYNQFGLSLYYGGRFDDALECFLRSDAVGIERGLQAGLQGLAHAAGILAAAGRMPEAAEITATALARPWPDGWPHGYPGSLLQAARTWMALEDDDPAAAAAHLATLDPHRSTIEHWALLEHLDALILLMRDDARDAANQIEAVERMQHKRKAVGTFSAERVRQTRILINLARGDVSGAERLAASLAPGAGKDVACARIRLAAGDAHGALQALASAPIVDEDPRLRAEHLALAAAALAIDGEGATDDERVAALRRLKEHLAAHDLSVPLVLVPTAALAAMRDLAAGHRLGEDFLAEMDRARARAVIASQRRGPQLTAREQVVARALTSGDTVTQIAADLSVSPNTVKTQLRAIYRKLGVSSRDEAVRMLAAQTSDDAFSSGEDTVVR